MATLPPLLPVAAAAAAMGGDYTDNRRLHNKVLTTIASHTPFPRGKLAAKVAPCWENWQSDVPISVTSDEKARREQLWREFFSDPSQWRDDRLKKKGPRDPDFRHKTTLEALWIDGWLNPRWVKEKIATMTFHQMHFSAKSTSRVPSSCGSYDKIQKLCEEGRLKEALHLLEHMAHQSSEAPKNAFVYLLRVCTKRKALAEGKQVHALIIQIKWDTTIFLSNLLVDMYSNCGSVVEAFKVFSAMPRRNVYSWTAMISAFSNNGQHKEALTLFQQMQQTGIEPTKVTCIVVLKACTSIAALKQGQKLHALIIKRGFDTDVIVQTSLLYMYAKCGCLKEARDLFNDMRQRDLVSWNAMIAAYAKKGFGKEALDLYEQMKHEGVDPNKVTLILLLKACASISALEQGKQLHSFIREKDLESETIVKTTLVDMYAKCGCLKDARELFNNMPQRNVVSWNAMIAGYAQKGLGKEALNLFDKMQQEGIEPDNITLVLLLKACASISALEQGKQLHSLILQKGLESERIIQNTLVDMYAKCGCLKDAHELFINMPRRDVVSWNALIAGYAQQGLGKEALELYKQMEHEGMEPNSVTLVLLLRVCGCISALEKGKQLHLLILEKGLDSEITIMNTLLDMYVKCGCLKVAREVFNNLSQRDVDSWNGMIAGYAEKGLGHQALDLYEQMKHESTQPDNLTLVLLVKACASISALEQGKQLHSLILEKGLESETAIQTTLVDMYAKCGCLKDARELFNNMLQRDLVSWSVMIAAYAQKGLGKEALDIYELMKHESVEPDNITLVLLLKACASISALEQGKQLHSLILEKGLESEMIIQNALVDMYAKCGCLKEARDLFNNMAQQDVVSWNAMITAYAQKGLGKEALDLYDQMKHGGMDPDKVTLALLLKACASISALEKGKQLHSLILEKGFELETIIQTTLVDMYAKCGCLEDARELFNNMPQRNVVSWNAMIAAYVQKGFGKEALDLCEQMKHEGMEPNHLTLVLLLKACGSLSALEQGKQLHSLILEKGLESEMIIQNSLVHMYGKCGCLEDAYKLFNNMPQCDVVSWNAMIAAYAQKGLGKEALDLYEQMKFEGMEPDNLTLVLLVKVCASISALEHGKQFHSLILEKGLESEATIQTTLLDMYAKCGCLEEAHKLFNNMPERDAVSWNAMIAGYAQKGLAKEALDLYEQMKHEGLQANEVTYSCVLSACSRSGLVDEGCHVFESMLKDHGVTPNLEHYGCMVDLLARAGFLAGAKDFILAMPIQPDDIIWMSLLGAARKYADAEIGRCAFEHVVRLKPQQGSAPYLLLMDIYSAAGRMDEVAKLRKEMKHKPWRRLGCGCS